MKIKNQLDFLFQNVVGALYIIVCIDLAFLRIHEITFHIVILCMIIYIICFVALSMVLTVFKCRYDPIICSETKNSDVIESGPPFVHIESIKKRYHENTISWTFQKSFWLSFTAMAIIMIIFSRYL